jgi:hypothetical protein
MSVTPALTPAPASLVLTVKVRVDDHTTTFTLRVPTSWATDGASHHAKVTEDFTQAIALTGFSICPPEASSSALPSTMTLPKSSAT